VSVARYQTRRREQDLDPKRKERSGYLVGPIFVGLARIFVLGPWVIRTCKESVALEIS
jgi:hypothetical protein